MIEEFFAFLPGYLVLVPRRSWLMFDEYRIAELMGEIGGRDVI